jgi:peptidylamidoglycolate lyase
MLFVLLSTVTVHAESMATTTARRLPIDRAMGAVTGLGVNSQQMLLVFHRADRTWDSRSFTEDNKFDGTPIKNATIFVVDTATGHVVEEHGANTFLMPHGLSIDKEDNVWLTDVGLHQVFKFAPGDFSKPLLTIGVAKEPGNDRRHLCKPTDVAVASNGDFFVADGYCNARILKYNAKGEVVAEFGSANSDSPPLDGEFWTPHSLALIEDLDLLCVADRDNERIQCFSAGLGRRSIPTGIFFTKAEGIGRVFAIREREHYLIGVTDSDSTGQIEPQLFVMDMDTGKASTFAKGIDHAHALAVTSNGQVFVARLNPHEIVEISL